MLYSVSHGLPAHPLSSVKFEDVKKKYRMQEDITISYELDKECEPSSRNWIGLYQKEATNLHQYVTFEWTLPDQRHEVQRKQSVTFCAKYHENYIVIGKEYYFIFVDTQMKVIGASPCFHFFPQQEAVTHNLESGDKPRTGINHHKGILCSTLQVASQIPEVDCDSSDSVIFSPPIRAQHVELDMHQPLPSLQLSGIMCNSSFGGSKTEITLASPDCPPSVTSSISNSGTIICPKCRRPSNFAEIEQKLHSKIKVGAEHSHTLLKRIEELEKDIEMCQVAQKRLKLAAQHSKEEKKSYQKFVHEMLTILQTKGAIRILDGRGNELFLKRVSGAVNEKEDYSLLYKASHRESILKSVIGTQEKTINELLSKLSTRSSPQPLTALKEMKNERVIMSGLDVHMNSVTAQSMQKAVNESSESLLTIFPQQKGSEKPNEESLSTKEDSIERVLNETFSVDEPVSITLPHESPEEPLGGIAEEEDEKEELNILAIEKQVSQDMLLKEKSVHELRHNMMQELNSVFRKRQEGKDSKTENIDFKSKVAVQSVVDKDRKGSTALVINGDSLQFALIRIQNSSLKM